MAGQMFLVDPRGLKKIVGKRDLSRLFAELFSNVNDEDVTECHITFIPTGSHMEYRIAVEDNSPIGFRDLSHAYTLFAESYKKGDPSKSGLYNFGEKMVIAVCKSARITSTKGTVLFDKDGRRTSREKRTAGSIFEGFLTVTKEQADETLRRIKRFIPKDSVLTTVNGVELPHRSPVMVFQTTLKTVTENAERELVKAERACEVRCYRVPNNEKPMLYALGTPVMLLDSDSGDVFDVDVRQRMPMGFSKDSVNTAYLKRVRTEVVNNGHSLLTSEQASAPMVTDALENATPEAVETIMTKRYGEKRAVYDPSDVEANNRLAAQGYTIIPSNDFTKKTWRNIRSSGAVQASGKIAPTPKPYSEGGPPVPVIKDLTTGMERMKRFIVLLAQKVCGVSAIVTFVNAPRNGFGMCCGKSGAIDVNVGRLGRAYFNQPPCREAVLDLLLDEFGHFEESNHLSDNYYRLLRTNGARMAMLMLEEPELFKDYR